MESYETELTSPLRNLVGGQLARAMLIQVRRHLMRARYMHTRPGLLPPC